MRVLISLCALGLLAAGVAGCGGGVGGDISREEAEEPIATPEMVPILIQNLESTQTMGQSFAVTQCLKLGPAAAEALPALKELRTRVSDPDFLARIDSAIAVVEGTAPIPEPPQ